MASTNYQRGVAHERRTKAKLEADGWTVFRMAGSHSQCDLIAFRGRTERLFIQCGLGRKTRAAKMALADLAAEHDATAVMYGARGSVEVLTGKQAA